jgi:hypothetical protein
VCGKFLFLGWTVNSTPLCPISAIASQAAKPTEDTMGQTLYNYLITLQPKKKQSSTTGWATWN